MSFTPEELEKITQLRSRVLKHLTKPEEQSTDHFLIKWLRARQMSVDKAEDMLVKSMEWRRANNIDNILETFDLPLEFQQKIPFAYLGQDPTSGCPVFLYLMGRDDMRANIEAFGVEKVLKMNTYFMEYIHKYIFTKCSEAAGKPITQFVELIDLEHYSYRQLANKKLRDAVIQMQNMFDLNYPEVIQHISMVNAPKIFSILFNMMKPFVAKETLEKIEIHGPVGWKEGLGARFPVEIIPRHWGGKRDGEDDYCSGDKDIWIFGLDKEYFKDLDIVKIKPRDKVHLEYEITEVNSSINWKFKSEGHDISFGILHEDDGEEIIVKPIQRVDSHKNLQIGEIEVTKPGKYIVVFDNSYSYTKGKNIHHRIQVQRPVDAEVEEAELADLENSDVIDLN